MVTYQRCTLVTLNEIEMSRLSAHDEPMEPGGRTPAPKPIRLVQGFENTYDALTDDEGLRAPVDLLRWTKRNGLVQVHATSAQFAGLLEFRETLRAVLRAHNGMPLDTVALDSLNGLCASAEVGVSFSRRGRPVITSAPEGADSVVIGAILDAALVGARDGSWERLKACPACGWVFFDHSRNRSGTWCTMAICGSRAKMKAYRKRRIRGGDERTP
jgi:predicted RNA-binding Zn ribbon-like protein